MMKAGIDSNLQSLLISAGLDLETLQTSAHDSQYLASELKDAGKMSFPRALLFCFLLDASWCQL